ncbi:competence protein CoiA family protein [Kytococcus aerolatus]|nr:hypothetical protein [Kytococcus aerolatus]
MSEEHRVLQRRIRKALLSVGITSEREHYPSHSDVWVPRQTHLGIERPLSIEVQRWMTGVDRRTKKREALGAQVLWLLPERAVKSAGRMDLLNFLQEVLVGDRLWVPRGHRELGNRSGWVRRDDLKAAKRRPSLAAARPMEAAKLGSARRRPHDAVPMRWVRKVSQVRTGPVGSVGHRGIRT